MLQDQVQNKSLRAFQQYRSCQISFSQDIFWGVYGCLSLLLSRNGTKNPQSSRRSNLLIFTLHFHAHFGFSAQTIDG